MALVVLVAVGAFLAIGAAFDLATDSGGMLPSDHQATFTAVADTNWQHATAVAHPITTYVIRADAGYAAFEFLFAVLFLVVVTIPLRRGERWAWWCCWIVLLAFAAFAALFGAHDAGNLWSAIAAAVVAATALLTLRPRPRNQVR